MNDEMMTALVLILAKQIQAEKKVGGTTRIGGDYTADAARLIKEKTAHVMQLLR